MLKVNRAALGATVVLATGAVLAIPGGPVGASHAANGAPEPTSAAGTTSSVGFDNGELRWSIPVPENTGADGVVAAQPCLSLAGSATTNVCVTGARKLQVERDGTRWQIPAQLAVAGSSAAITVRQADLSLPAGPASATTTCSGAGCASGDPVEVTVPALVVESCTAQDPWLVYEGLADRGKAVAITFDDGPSPATVEILDILAEEGVSGTFFQVGRYVPGQDAIEQRIRAEGHVLANHSYNHPVMQGGFVSEITDTQDAIRKASGFTPCLFRAPYGENPPEVVALARDHALLTVKWNTDSTDWKGAPADAMVANLTATTQPGSIMVFHDSGFNPDTPEAVRRYVQWAKQQGYRFLTIPEIVGLPIQYQS